MHFRYKGHLLSPLIVVLLSGCSVLLADFTPLEFLSYITPVIERFNYRTIITIDNSPYAESFTDFPLMVRLDGINDINTDRLNSTPLIRFYPDDGSGNPDADNPLAFEVEEWNPGGESIIWIKVPFIPDSGTAEIYFYYDYYHRYPLNAHNEDVWTDNYLSVLHLNESTGSYYMDSSPRKRGGISGVTRFGRDYTAPSPAVGRIGGGQSYETTDTAILIENYLSGDIAPVTVTFWHNASENPPASRRYFLLGDDTDTRVDNYTGSSGKLNFELRFSDADNGNDPDTALLGQNSEVSSIQGNWICHSFTWDGNNNPDLDGGTDPMGGMRYWKDGIYRGGNRGDHRPGNGSYIGNSGVPLFIGSAWWNNTSLLGIYDEFRVSSVVRSQNWIKAQYASMNDSYLSFGTEEEMIHNQD